MNNLLLLWSWFIRIILFFLPDVPFIMRFRGALYGFGMKKCGEDFQVTHDATIKGLQRITVGSHCFVGNGSIIMGGGSITIEDEVIIAPHVIIISGNHVLKEGSFRFEQDVFGTIVLGRGSWVAGNCTVALGSYLPQGSVLGANSFLNKQFSEPYSLYGGVPAKFIKSMRTTGDFSQTD